MNEKLSARIFLGISLSVIVGLIIYEINERRKNYYHEDKPKIILDTNYNFSALEQQAAQSNNPAVNERFITAFNYATQLKNNQSARPAR